jgi:hypothetical protein
MRHYRDRDDSRETDIWIPIVLAALALVLLTIVALVTNYPAVSEWVSAAAQAEFVNPDVTAVGPSQIAQPAEQMRIVRSN